MTIKIINDLLLKSAYVSQFPTENQFQKGIKDTNVNVQVHVYYLCKALPKRTNCSIIFSLLICSPRYYVKRPSTNKCFFLNKYLTVTMFLNKRCSLSRDWLLTSGRQLVPRLVQNFPLIVKFSNHLITCRLWYLPRDYK